jgi:hypothetical protein
MTTPTSTNVPRSDGGPGQPPRAGALQRYGPLTGIVVAIVVVAAMVTFAGRDGNSQVTASNRPGNPNGGGAPSEMPVAYEQAKAEGREQSIRWVDNCDTATGRIRMPIVHAPPCVPAFSGENGGETAPGVTADTITVVYYVPPRTGDVMAQLSGNLDSPEASRETIAKFVEMLNSVVSMYGRRVDLKYFQGEAASTDAVAARAEAVKVIDEFQPFASINGPALTPAYAEELAANKVLCLGCGGTLSDQAFQDNAPYLWGPSATPEQWINTVAEYLGKRLAGRPARWAGDPAGRSATRKFGIVNLEQDPPQFGALSSLNDRCEGEVGWKAAARESYLLTSMADRTPTIIAKLKAERITTVVFMGDPIMPITLTAEATKQGYFPEWVITGTGFTDIAVFGRRYDQRQWEHAFGLSQLAVTLPREEYDGWKLHQWYYGAPPAAQRTASVLWANISQLFNGIHMAGPNLTAESFRDGLFNLPPAGGGPTAPRVSYGDRGTFPVINQETCKPDGGRVDYMAGDDMAEVWWDVRATGPDEQGVEGRGKYRYANGGRRYLPGNMPDTEADAFKEEGSVLDFPVRPEVDRAPDYPSPRR